MSSEHKSVTFILLGYGHIGRRHAALISTLPNAKLIGIADTNLSTKQHADYPVEVPFFESADAILESNLQADVTILALPNGLHTNYAIQCLQKGMNVLIEKPMGLTESSCQDVLKAAEASGKQVFVVKQNRYSPPVKWLKNLVQSGVLGKTVLLQVNCFWNRDDRYYKENANSWRGTQDLDGGVLFTQFSHFIDIMFWLFGEWDIIHAEMYNRTHQGITPFPDTGLVQIKLKDGGLGTLNFTTSVWQQNMESSITIIAENGSLKVGGQYMDQVEYCHISGYEMPHLPPANPPNQYGPYTGSAANHIYVLENVVQSIMGYQKPAISGEEGLAVVHLIEEMYQAAGF